MPLPIRPMPRALAPAPLELIWPADTAVDQDASDLLAWARAGGARDGLIMRPGAEPDVIRARAIRDYEMAIIAEEYAGGTDLLLAATRVGVVSVPGLQLRWVTRGHLRLLDDASIDSLMSDSLAARYPVSWVVRETYRLRGVDLPHEDEQELATISPAYGLGGLILLATFRGRHRG